MKFHVLGPVCGAAAALALVGQNSHGQVGPTTGWANTAPGLTGTMPIQASASFGANGSAIQFVCSERRYLAFVPWEGAGSESNRILVSVQVDAGPAYRGEAILSASSGGLVQFPARLARKMLSGQQAIVTLARYPNSVEEQLAHQAQSSTEEVGTRERDRRRIRIPLAGADPVVGPTLIACGLPVAQPGEDDRQIHPEVVDQFEMLNPEQARSLAQTALGSSFQMEEDVRSATFYRAVSQRYRRIYEVECLQPSERLYGTQMCWSFRRGRELDMVKGYLFPPIQTFLNIRDARPDVRYGAPAATNGQRQPPPPPPPSCTERDTDPLVRRAFDLQSNYPTQLRENGAEATISARIDVDVQGRVTAISQIAVEGDSALVPAFEAGVRRMDISPARGGCENVPGSIRVRVVFSRTAYDRLMD